MKLGVVEEEKEIMLLRELWFEQVCNVLSINKQIRDTCWQVLIYLSRTEVSCDFFFVIHYFALTFLFPGKLRMRDYV